MAFMLPRKRWFYIASGTQLSESVSTFSDELQMPDQEVFDRIVLTQVLIPLSYYVIQNGTNTFILNENGVDTIITIPPGQYDTVNFPVVVEALLTANSPNSLTYTITYPDSATQPQTNKFTYNASSNTDLIYFQFPPGSDLAIRFGFDRTVDYETQYFSFVSAGSTLTSENVVDFTALNTIFIHTNLVQDEAGSDILQEIFEANTPPGTNITYLCPDPLAYSKKLSSSKIRYASFSLTDEFNTPIYLNGLEVILTLCIYKEPNFFELAEKYIEYLMRRDINEGLISNLEDRDNIARRNLAHSDLFDEKPDSYPVPRQDIDNEFSPPEPV